MRMLYVSGLHISSAQKLSSKWRKTKLLGSEASLQKHIPVTRPMTRTTLNTMLASNGMVYVKPSIGSLGRGVMRVERFYDQYNGRRISYAYQLGASRRVFGDYEALYGALLKETKGKRYIVQRGIHALKHDGNVFDLRVVVQRSPSGGWEVTGIVGRVAQPGKIVSNGTQGGSIMPAQQLLYNHTGFSNHQRLMRQLERIGIQTMKKMHRANPKLKEIGIDIAIDRNLKPWILEVNVRPDHCPFAVLRDQTMIKRIIQYGAAYGRTYKLNCFRKAN
ncbi:MULTISPECIES: YheC/YheD family protein [unclassified Paenibacillus]|uniref:YheC/YheD family protein n=1 Tax=unclassified Paenibacillus TaxID=185978 RepID=UPI002F41698D